MTGLRVSTGEPVIHFALLIGIMFIDRSQKCDQSNFENLMNLLLAAHVFNAFRIVLNSILVQVRAIYPNR
jgi:hypothetical protein